MKNLNFMDKNFQSRFLLMSLVVIILECFVLGFIIKSNLDKPTIQNLAKMDLVKFAMAKTLKKRITIFENALQSRIYLWPKDGISLDEKGSIPSKVEKVLLRDFGKEYKNLEKIEKQFLKEKTLPFIERDIQSKRKGFFLDVNLFSYTKESFEKALFISKNSVGITRYFWNGYNKTLLFFLLKDRIYFASISDIADKVSFLFSILTPLFILITSTFILIYLNYLFNIKRQNKINEEIQAFLDDSQRKNIQLGLQKKELKNLLENLGQGFMIFNKEGIIQNGATLASKNIFKRNPEGENIKDLLGFSSYEKDIFKKWTLNVWRGLLSFKDLKPLAPPFFEGENGRHIDLDFRPIYIEGSKRKIDKIICIATDKTQEIELERQVDLDKQKAKFITSCLQNPVGFVDL
jgi:hypothetical protein